MGSILGFTRFSKIIIGKPSSVTSQVIKAPLISTERSELRDQFLEEIMVHFAAYYCFMVVGRPKALPSTNFKQITKEGSKP